MLPCKDTDQPGTPPRPTQNVTGQALTSPDQGMDRPVTGYFRTFPISQLNRVLKGVITIG
ncbi:MAG: hypothetical protein PSV16_11520 [Flavobacterium sp.]|nr:hypothetical protein [Flavobacterium sp.]